jgi:hypothetical protein
MTYRHLITVSISFTLIVLLFSGSNARADLNQFIASEQTIPKDRSINSDENYISNGSTVASHLEYNMFPQEIFIDKNGRNPFKANTSVELRETDTSFISVIINQDWGAGVWNNNVQTIYTYDLLGQLIEETRQTWAGSAWENDQRKTYIHDASGRRQEYYSQNWVIDTWVNNYLATYNYDVFGNLVEYSSQTWELESWINSSQGFYIYSVNNLLVESTNQSWNGNSWDYSNKGIYFYDPNGNLLENISQTWTGTDWENNGHSIRTLDINDNLIDYTYQIWVDAEWENRNRTIFTLDVSGNLLESTSQNWNENEWENFQHHYYLYDSFNNMIESTSQNWDGSAWTFLGQGFYIYSVNNLLVESTNQSWNGDNWENSSHRIDTYDDDGYLVQKNRHIWDGNNWVNADLVIYQYIFIPTPIVLSLSPPLLEIATGDTASFELIYNAPEDFTMNSLELTFDGYGSGLELLSIDTSNSLVGNAQWSSFTFVSDSSVSFVCSGGAAISDNGKIFQLDFIVTSVLPEVIPITINSVIINEQELSALITTGADITVIPIIPGDVSGNGTVQAHDAFLLLKYLVGTEQLDEMQLSSADVSLDHTVSAFDASLIMMHVFGQIDMLPLDTLLTAEGEFIFQDGIYNANADVELPIYGNNLQNIQSFYLEIAFDTSVFEYQNVLWDNSLENFSFETVQTENKILISGASVVSTEDNQFIGTLNFRSNESTNLDEPLFTILTLRLNENVVLNNISECTMLLVPVSTNDLRVPTSYAIKPNYPNPFNPSTTIKYGIPEDSNVSLVIYDIRGNTVRSIDSGSQVAGWYEHVWNGMDDTGQPVSTGLYLTRLSAGSYTKTIKMLYLK